MTELFNFILQNDLLVEGVLTLASASIPALIPIAHLFKQKKQVMILLDGMDMPNEEILVEAEGKVSAGLAKVLKREFNKIENKKEED